ncbi:AMP-binding protein [Streptomyces sp. NPDC059679]|uniref:AMP-binding protein n=1 Tax=Streptomyces sp. NPDC059679 TaxID=3346903 RepID=UPI003679DAFA
MSLRTGTASLSLADVVWRRAGEQPDGLALVELRDTGDDLTLSWHELVDLADRTATVLTGLGVRPGQTVVAALPNSADLVTVSLALLRIGAVVCPVLPSLREHELGHVLRRSCAHVLVVPESFRGRGHPCEVSAMAEAGLAPDLRHLLIAPGHSPAPSATVPATHRLAAGVAVARPAGASARPPGASPHDVAHLLFTSGTTGEPKGVPHRMDTLNRAALLTADRLGLTSRDRVHIAAPMAHHSGFLYGMWLSLLLGSAQIVQPTWNADRALRAFREWGGTFMQGSTPFLLDLVDAVEAGATAPAALRTFVITGASVPRALLARARARLGVRVCAAWGSTETCMATLSAPEDEPESVAATDGRPLAGVRLRVTDDSGAELAAGCEGHLEMTGPLVFDGYLGRDDRTAEAFTPDGWYRTGDLAVLEPSGYLRITGRAKDVINRGGEKIPVGAIEQLLAAHPSVRESALVAMPDRRLGERACLFVALYPGKSLKLSDVQEFLDVHRVTKHYWPERVELVGALPRNPAGKVQKFLLRDRLRREFTPPEGSAIQC